MNLRLCYNCGRSLENEPAIRGLNGLLCFPCRYNFDKRGGERFLLEYQIYEEKKKDWEAKHKGTWVKYQRLKGFSQKILYFVVIFFSSPLIFFIFNKVNKILIFLCFLLGGISLFLWRILSLRAERLEFIPPPEVPRKEKNALSGFLDVVFESELKDNSEFLRVKGYPPDWEERQRSCLTRDGYKCRICGKTKNLHIHHIKPISFGGIHSLQNLITLCKTCHKSQEYYQHIGLIRENIKATRRYWVSPHTRSGKSISGYFRKTGRRGLFWRKVRRIRSP